MSDDNVLDQNEIERLLGGGGGAAAASPPAPEPAAVDAGVLDQSELDALFAGGGGAHTPSASAASAGPLDQSELDALFAGSAAKPAAAKPAPVAAAPKPAAFGGAAPGGFDDADGEDDEEGVPRGDIDYLLKRADESLRSIASEKLDLPTEVIEFQFPEFGGTVPSTEHATLDQISEVELDVKIELGRTNMYLEDVLKLRKGSVVPLDKMAGDAIDIYINGRLLARGEVLVMNENFCVRVAELLAGAIPME